MVELGRSGKIPVADYLTRHALQMMERMNSICVFNNLWKK